ncbi:MAG: glycyl-radical enzyme activating protein [Clostridiales bacterium]|nr:glycyl-radical enzyme activating protein [Clostridiales bacterium]
MGLVMDVQRFSLHDGPGIRTTAFLMGCNLRCRWCHNPESWLMTPRMMFYGNRCRQCGKCVPLCPKGAHHFDAEGHRVDLSFCMGCDKQALCEACCPGEAMVVCGREYTPEELVSLLARDRLFYGENGGVTFSGGEAMLQAEFLRSCLALCKGQGLHTCVDTAANVPQESILRVAEYCDLFLIDLKAMDEARHQRLCGTGNHQILENIRLLGEMRKPIWIRVPLVQGENALSEELHAMADFLMEIPSVQQVDLFPVMNHAQDKYRALNLQGGSFNLGIDGSKLVQAAMTTLQERCGGRLHVCSLL